MSTRIPFLRVALVVSLAAAASGCGGSAQRSRIDPREIRGRPVSEAVEVPVEVGGERVAMAWLSSGGAFTTRLGPAQNVLHVRLRVHNLEPAPVRVPLDLVCLEGIAGAGRLKPLALVGHDANRASVVVLAGASREIDLVFPVAQSLDLRTVNSFRLIWGIDVPGGIVRNETYFAASPDVHLQGRVARSFRPVAF